MKVGIQFPAGTVVRYKGPLWETYVTSLGEGFWFDNVRGKVFVDRRLAFDLFRRVESGDTLSWMI